MSHVAKVSVEGNIVYLGRKKTREEARAAEHAAREEHARTGRVERARAVYRRSVPSPDRHTTGDAHLWFDSHFGWRRDELQGEQRLMARVLNDAIQDLRGSNPRLSAAALRWFKDDDRSYLYAFATICDEFGIPVREARIDLLHGGREPLED